MGSKYFVIIPGSAPAEIVEFIYRRHKIFRLRIRWANIDPNFTKVIPYHKGLKIVTKRPAYILIFRKYYKKAVKLYKGAQKQIKEYLIGGQDK